MNKNVGTPDKFLRLILAAGAVAAAFLAVDGGWLRWGLLAVAAVMTLTALGGFCPLYRVVGVNTCKLKQQ
jgi:hypothetical protein